MQIEPISSVGAAASGNAAAGRVDNSLPTTARQLFAGMQGAEWSELFDRLQVPKMVRKPLVASLRDWLGGGVLPPEQRALLAQVPLHLSPDRRGELLARLYAQTLVADRPQQSLELVRADGGLDVAAAQRAVERAAIPPHRHPRALIEVAQWLGAGEEQAADWLLDAARERVAADGARRAARAFAALEKLAIDPPERALRLRFELPAALIEVSYAPPRSLFGWLALAVCAAVLISLWL